MLLTAAVIVIVISVEEQWAPSWVISRKNKKKKK